MSLYYSSLDGSRHNKQTQKLKHQQQEVGNVFVFNWRPFDNNRVNRSQKAPSVAAFSSDLRGWCERNLKRVFI